MTNIQSHIYTSHCDYTALHLRPVELSGQLRIVVVASFENNVHNEVGFGDALIATVNIYN